jgi:hypothetical protein
MSTTNENGWILISEDDEAIELKIASTAGTIRLATEGSTMESGIFLHSMSTSARSQISLSPDTLILWGWDEATIRSTNSSTGIISSTNQGAQLKLSSSGEIYFTSSGLNTFTWNNNPILTKANFKLTGTNNDILEITV